MIATGTALAIAATSAAVGGIVQGVGIYQQGKAQKNMARFNAKMAERNAIIQRNNSLQARQQASIEADRRRRLAKRIQGKFRADAIKSGSTLSGSVNDILYDTALEQEQDALTELYKGQVSGQAFATKAVESEAEADITRAQGAARYKAGLWGAGGTMLTGFTNAAGIVSQIPNNSNSGNKIS